MGKGLNSGRLGGRAGGANGVVNSVLAKIHPKACLSAEARSASSGIAVNPNTQIKRLLMEAADDIVSSEKSGRTDEENKSNINAKLISAARGFSMHDNGQYIKQLWQEIDRISADTLYREVVKNLFTDAVAMSGTPASVDFIVDLIKQGQMTKGQIVNFLTWMPHYIVYPTKSSLQKLYIIIRSEKIQNNMYIRNIAITSFTQLLQQACTSGQRQLSYPTFVTGEFCNVNSRIVKDEWIPYLLGELSSATTSNERNIYLVALGTLSHQDVIRELIPYVSGALTTQVGQKVTQVNRLMATYSLANVGSIQPDVTISTLLSVFSNAAEDTEMRIVAFNLLLKMNPPLPVFQRIAAVTQEELDMDDELLKTINIALYTIGRIDSYETVESDSTQIIQKSRIAFRLIRQVSGILPTSGKI